MWHRRTVYTKKSTAVVTADEYCQIYCIIEGKGKDRLRWCVQWVGASERKV